MKAPSVTPSVKRIDITNNAICAPNNLHLCLFDSPDLAPCTVYVL